MTEKDIKPIPNYILKEIHKRDMKIYPWQENIVRFYAYLTVWKKGVWLFFYYSVIAIKSDKPTQ